jgi:hypothetical protein
MSDFHDSVAVAKRMTDATRKLHELAPMVGHAKQIREYDSDRRKSALAIEIVRALKGGESATAADAIGRASENYKAKLESLAVQYEEAERIIAQWQAENCSFEAARSLLSFSKETLRQIE